MPTGASGSKTWARPTERSSTGGGSISHAGSPSATRSGSARRCSSWSRRPLTLRSRPQRAQARPQRAQTRPQRAQARPQRAQTGPQRAGRPACRGRIGPDSPASSAAGRSREPSAPRSLLFRITRRSPPCCRSARGGWCGRPASGDAGRGRAVRCRAEDGLRIVWGIGIPLLPILFFVAPGLWRNICPLAASNQAPRVLGITRALEAPALLKRYGYLRLDHPVRAVHHAAQGGAADQRSAQRPDADLRARQRDSPAGCSSRARAGGAARSALCCRFSESTARRRLRLSATATASPAWGARRTATTSIQSVAYLADLNDEDSSWSAGRKFFVAAVSGPRAGLLRGLERAEGLRSVVVRAACAVRGVSVASFFLLDAFTPVTPHKLTTLYGPPRSTSSTGSRSRRSSRQLRAAPRRPRSRGRREWSCSR